MVAKAFFENVEMTITAYGLNFPDGLVGGSLGATVRGPIILVAAGATDAAKEYMTENGIKSGYIMGGYKVVTPEVVEVLYGAAEVVEKKWK